MGARRDPERLTLAAPPGRGYNRARHATTLLRAEDRMGEPTEPGSDPGAAATPPDGFPDAEQRAVIAAGSGPLLVLAPAGTGKTRVMAERLAAALAGGLAPERALCVTFTNRAAGEVRRRVAARLGHAAGRVWISTFHALCAAILRYDAAALGLARDFVVYDEHDAADLLVDIARQRPQLAHAGTPLALAQRIADAKSRCPTAELSRRAVPDLFPAAAAAELRAAAATYHALLADRNALDFGDLIYRVRTLFAHVPERAERWAARFFWLQVDEVQDTHESEYEVLRHLALARRQLAFFGDVDQTIYGWRGSDPERVLGRFRKEFDPVQELALTRSHRATRTLLAAAEGFAALDPARRTRLVPGPGLPAGEPIRTHAAATLMAEAEWVAQHVRATLAAAPRGTTVGVLTRSHHRNRGIAAALARAGVPHLTVEEFQFFRRQEVKDALARLRLVSNPADSGAFQRTLLRPASGIGQATIREVRTAGARLHLRLADLARPETHRDGEPFAALRRALASGAVVVLDVESTGLSPATDEVVEVAALRLGPGAQRQEFRAWVRPTRPVGESERIHGWSDGWLAEHGRPAAQVLGELAEIVRGRHVVGHNVGFDLGLLTRQATQLGVAFAPAGVDDTLTLARRLLVLERYDLEALARHFGLAAQPSHQAAADVAATAELLLRLAPGLEAGAAGRAELVARYGAPFRAHAEQLAAWREAAGRERPGALLRRVLDESGLLRHYAAEPQRLTHLEQLAWLFEQEDKAEVPPRAALAELTAMAALARHVDDLAAVDGKVPVITVHQAKGLEFDVLFLAGLAECEFPSWHACRDGDVTEERRLFYVALTRARRQLYLSWPARDDRGREPEPSRFLSGGWLAGLSREE
ncbi:MAG: UvrD-helicase domain-containing protein [Planctomycetes bacterium]|nr:UvrD-helicase domain-containing protein [Planctomycetota bacterium]